MHPQLSDLNRSCSQFPRLPSLIFGSSLSQAYVCVYVYVYVYDDIVSICTQIIMRPNEVIVVTEGAGRLVESVCDMYHPFLIQKKRATQKGSDNAHTPRAKCLAPYVVVIPLSCLFMIW